MIIIIIILTAILWLASYLAVVTCTRQALRIGWAAAAITAYPVWWLVQILLTNALSHFHILTQANLIICTSGIIMISLLLSRRFHQKAEPHTILPSLLRPCVWEMALIGGILVCSFLAIFLSPSKVFDTTTYHLPTVATWLQQGSMDPYSTFCDRQVTRSHAGTIQQFWVIGMAHADPLGELPDLLACVVLALFVWCITRRWRLPQPLCLAATVSIWAIPQIVHASLSCKDDLMLTAGIMCSIYCLLISFERVQPARRWYAALAGVSIALTFGAKVPGLAFGTALLITAAVYCFRKKSWKKLSWMIDADWTLITVLLIGLPVFILKYIYTAQHFGVLWPEQWTEVRKPSIPVLYPLWYYFRLLISPFHHGVDANHDTSNFGLWFALVTVPVAMWGLARSAYQRWWEKRQEDILPPRFLAEWHLLALFALLSFGVESIHKPDPWDQRFMIWLCPVLLLLAAPLLTRYAPLRLLRGLASALAIITVYFTLHYGFPYLKPFIHLCKTGEFTEMTDLGESSTYYVSGYEAFAIARPGDVVLYLGADGTVEYPCWGWRLDRVVVAPTTTKELHDDFQRLQPRWIVIETPADHFLRNEALRLAEQHGYTMLADAHPTTDQRYLPDPYNSRTIWIREPVPGMWKHVDKQDLPGQREKVPIATTTDE